MKEIVIIGYSGHAYVVCDTFASMDHKVIAYAENEMKKENPYRLKYYGSEKDPKFLEKIKNTEWFVSIGDNNIREKVLNDLGSRLNSDPMNAIHKNAVISDNASLSYGIMIGANTVINAAAKIAKGVICNTASVIEHECIIGAFSHIAPSATLCGNVHIGEKCLIGANAVILPNIKIGDKVIVGAGSVVNRDLESNSTFAGNPLRKLI